MANFLLDITSHHTNDNSITAYFNDGTAVQLNRNGTTYYQTTCGKTIEKLPDRTVVISEGSLLLAVVTAEGRTIRWSEDLEFIQGPHGILGLTFGNGAKVWF